MNMMRLVEIRRYPVKSLRGHSLEEANVERIGLAGDRRWMIVDAANVFLTQRQYPKLAQFDAALTGKGVVLRHAAYGALEIDIPDHRAALEMVTYGATRSLLVSLNPRAPSSRDFSRSRSDWFICMTRPRVRSIRFSVARTIASASPMVILFWSLPQLRWMISIAVSQNRSPWTAFAPISWWKVQRPGKKIHGEACASAP
jgi:hypothetical protein